MVNISKHKLRPDFSTLVLFQKSRDLFRCNYLLYSTCTYSTRLNFTQFLGFSIRWQYLISGTSLVSAWPGFQVSWPNPKLWRQQTANHRLDSQWCHSMSCESVFFTKIKTAIFETGCTKISTMVPECDKKQRLDVLHCCVACKWHHTIDVYVSWHVLYFIWGYIYLILCPYT